MGEISAGDLTYYQHALWRIYTLGNARLGVTLEIKRGELMWIEAAQMRIQTDTGTSVPCFFTFRFEVTRDMQVQAETIGELNDRYVQTGWLTLADAWCDAYPQPHREQYEAAVQRQQEAQPR